MLFMNAFLYQKKLKWSGSDIMEIEEVIEKIVVTINTLINTVDEMESKINKLETIIIDLIKKSE